MKEEQALRAEAVHELRRLLARRDVRVLFQPIFGFRAGRIIGHEALVRGTAGSPIESPQSLFAAARDAGLSVEVHFVCIQAILRAFTRLALEGLLFVNVSPELIVQRGFDRERAERFMRQLGLVPERVVIELTEDYPTFDFNCVRESLMAYRAMGFRVAIDDLGEGFASLRLWSELRPEFVKADKHFVLGIARDPVKLEFLRAIHQIAETSGSRIVAEGIERAEDFRLVKDIGVACGQGWFIGPPAESPNRRLPVEAERARADERVPVPPAPRGHALSERRAHDFIRIVDAVAPHVPLAELLARFERSCDLAAIPVLGAAGIEGVVSRCHAEVAASARHAEHGACACVDFMDPAPLRVEADMDCATLAAMLMSADARRLADGFVILARGRYLGMGRAQDVVRALHTSRMLAARHTNPLTALPGLVPVNEHAARLLEREAPFAAWSVGVEALREFNDVAGFEKGDAVLRDAARLVESACEPGIDFVGQVSGSRFVVLMQSVNWHARAQHVLARFPAVVEPHAPPRAPRPRMAIGIARVVPGAFTSRHEVLALANRAKEDAARHGANALHVEEQGPAILRR